MPRLGSIYSTNRPYILKFVSGEFLERMITPSKPRLTSTPTKAVIYDKIKAINNAQRLRKAGFEVEAIPIS